MKYTSNVSAYYNARLNEFYLLLTDNHSYYYTTYVRKRDIGFFKSFEGHPIQRDSIFLGSWKETSEL